MTLTIAQIATIVGMVCAILGAVAGYSGGKRLDKLDATGDGKEKGELVTDIKYIKDGIDELKEKQKEQDKQYIEVIVRVAQVEQSCKSLHKRVDHWEDSHFLHNDSHHAHET